MRRLGALAGVLVPLLGTATRAAADEVKIPGSRTSLAFGGQAKLDVIFNSVSAGADRFGDQYLYISQLPVGDARSGEHGQLTILAKESRFWFKSFTPTSLGDIQTLIELDFYGAQDAYLPRLRHAYGIIGGLLAGQTWTTFTNAASIPETLDPGTPVGEILIRQPQARFTQPLAGPALAVAVAIEAPRSKLTKGAEPAIVTTGADRFPDMVVRLESTGDWGTMSLSGLGRQVRSSAAMGPMHEEWGGAVGLAGRANTFGLDNLRFMFNFGNGAGRYVTLDTYADGATDGAGRMELSTIYSGMLAYQHYWTNRLRSTLAVSSSHADLPGFASATATRGARSVHLNLLWTPFQQFTVGVEYIYALRQLHDGQDGDLHRLECSTRFTF